jgi:hypothetical protein
MVLRLSKLYLKLVNRKSWKQKIWKEIRSCPWLDVSGSTISPLPIVACSLSCPWSMLLNSSYRTHFTQIYMSEMPTFIHLAISRIQTHNDSGDTFNTWNVNWFKDFIK